MIDGRVRTRTTNRICQENVMLQKSENPWRTRGMKRMVNAVANSTRGISYGLSHDSAIRQVSVAVVVLCLGAIFLPVGAIERLILILTTMLVVLVEYINSAIEATVDRVSLERHPLSGQAKDLGSVAVAIAVLMCSLSWLVIAGPVVAKWFSQ